MTFADKNLEYREILTKAICGKGRRFSQATHYVTPSHRPSSILGAWIINNQFEAVKSGNGIEVVGTYDINVWYSYSNNSKTDVAKETVSYVECVPLSYVDPRHRASTVEVCAEAIQDPNCVEATIAPNGSEVIVRVEREFAVEMIAETKLCVVVNPRGIDGGDKDYDFAFSDGEYEEIDSDLLDDLDDHL